METGLLLLIHRYLDPFTGRLLTGDPTAMKGGANLHTYASNSPADQADVLRYPACVVRCLVWVGLLVCWIAASLQIFAQSRYPDPESRPDWRERWLRGVRGLDGTNNTYDIQVARRRGELEVYLSVFIRKNGKSRLLRCTELEGVGGYLVLPLQAIPDPEFPKRKVLLVYTDAQYPWGTLYRLDAKSLRPVPLLNAEFLDTSEYLSRGRIAEWTWARLCFPEVKDFNAMARRWWYWDRRKGRFVCTRWVTAKPPRGFWKRFGY